MEAPPLELTFNLTPAGLHFTWDPQSPQWPSHQEQDWFFFTALNNPLDNPGLNWYWVPAGSKSLTWEWNWIPETFPLQDCKFVYCRGQGGETQAIAIRMFPANPEMVNLIEQAKHQPLKLDDIPPLELVHDLTPTGICFTWNLQSPQWPAYEEGDWFQFTALDKSLRDFGFNWYWVPADSNSLTWEWSWIPEGFPLQDCKFVYCRGQGVVIQAVAVRMFPANPEMVNLIEQAKQQTVDEPVEEPVNIVAGGDSFSVTLKTMTAKAVVITPVTGNTTVGELKMMFHQIEGYYPNKLIKHRGNYRLEDDTQTLLYHEVVDGDTFTVM